MVCNVPSGNTHPGALYTCLPSTASSGDSSSSVEDLFALLSGGVSGVGFSVCAEREMCSH